MAAYQLMIDAKVSALFASDPRQVTLFGHTVATTTATATSPPSNCASPSGCSTPTASGRVPPAIALRLSLLPSDGVSVSVAARVSPFVGAVRERLELTSLRRSCDELNTTEEMLNGWLGDRWSGLDTPEGLLCVGQFESNLHHWLSGTLTAENTCRFCMKVCGNLGSLVMHERCCSSRTKHKRHREGNTLDDGAAAPLTGEYACQYCMKVCGHRGSLVMHEKYCKGDSLDDGGAATAPMDFSQVQLPSSSTAATASCHVEDAATMCHPSASPTPMDITHVSLVDACRRHMHAMRMSVADLAEHVGWPANGVLKLRMWLATKEAAGTGLFQRVEQRMRLYLTCVGEDIGAQIGDQSDAQIDKPDDDGCDAAQATMAGRKDIAPMQVDHVAGTGCAMTTSEMTSAADQLFVSLQSHVRRYGLQYVVRRIFRSCAISENRFVAWAVGCASGTSEARLSATKDPEVRAAVYALLEAFSMECGAPTPQSRTAAAAGHAYSTSRVGARGRCARHMEHEHMAHDVATTSLAPPPLTDPGLTVVHAKLDVSGCGAVALHLEPRRGVTVSSLDARLHDFRAPNARPASSHQLSAGPMPPTTRVRTPASSSVRISTVAQRAGISDTLSDAVSGSFLRVCGKRMRVGSEYQVGPLPAVVSRTVQESLKRCRCGGGSMEAIWRFGRWWCASMLQSKGETGCGFEYTPPPLAMEHEAPACKCRRLASWSRGRFWQCDAGACNFVSQPPPSHAEPSLISTDIHVEETAHDIAALLTAIAFGPVEAFCFASPRSDCGIGLFARTALQTGQFIAEYGGPRLPARLHSTGQCVTCLEPTVIGPAHSTPSIMQCTETKYCPLCCLPMTSRSFASGMCLAFQARPLSLMAPPRTRPRPPSVTPTIPPSTRTIQPNQTPAWKHGQSTMARLSSGFT